MNDPIIFEPLQTTAMTYWLLGGLIACVALLVYSIINKYKVLSAVSGLIALILLGSTIFNWISDKRTTEIIISENSIESMYGTVYFKDIQNVYIQEDIKSPVAGENTANNTDRYLVIESSKKKFPLPFSETTFAIDSIKQVLDNRYKNWLEGQ